MFIKNKNLTEFINELEEIREHHPDKTLAVFAGYQKQKGKRTLLESAPVQPTLEYKPTIKRLSLVRLHSHSLVSLDNLIGILKHESNYDTIDIKMDNNFYPIKAVHIDDNLIMNSVFNYIFIEFSYKSANVRKTKKMSYEPFFIPDNLIDFNLGEKTYNIAVRYDPPYFSPIGKDIDELQWRLEILQHLESGEVGEITIRMFPGIQVLDDKPFTVGKNDPNCFFTIDDLPNQTIEDVAEIFVEFCKNPIHRFGITEFPETAKNETVVIETGIPTKGTLLNSENDPPEEFTLMFVFLTLARIIENSKERIMYFLKKKIQK